MTSNDIWLIMLSLCAALLHGLKNYEKTNSALERVRTLSYSMIGAALTVWVSFELLMYFSLPDRLCLAISASLGYFGSEMISKFLFMYLEKKIMNTNK